MDELQLIARLLLSATFAVAGVAKLFNRAGSRQSMIDFGLPHWFARSLAWILPSTELLCAVALIPLASAFWGAAGVLVMLLAFIVTIGLNMAQGRRPNCQCFGQLHSAPVGWPTLTRNAVLAAIAVLILWPGAQSPGASLGDWLTGPWQAITAALLALAAYELWLLLDLLRQNARLILRLEAVEAKLGVGTEVAQSPRGLPVDTPAPTFVLPDFTGRSVTLDMLGQGNKPIIMVFTNSNCPPCDALLPELARWQSQHSDSLSIVAVTRGSLDVNREKIQRHNLRTALLQTDDELTAAYQAQLTPSAVLVRDGRIASPLAAGADEIGGLVTRALLPAPLKKGDPAPHLELPTLDGGKIDLASRRGRRTLLLFWSPSCAFCRNMLPDLKKWERNRPRHAPELLVVTSGPKDDNREQGFRSPVLLDQGLSARHVFGADGTPAAVLLDEDARVASEVGIGAEGVLTLAGVTSR